MIGIDRATREVHVDLTCEPCDEAHPHSMVQMADGAIAFVCWACGTQTVLREEPAGEPASV